jgi:hypothetical protein
MKVIRSDLDPTMLVDVDTGEMTICSSADHADRLIATINSVDRLVASLTDAAALITANNKDLILVRDKLRELNATFEMRSTLSKMQGKRD